jgi:hypothetical protein
MHERGSSPRACPCQPPRRLLAGGNGTSSTASGSAPCLSAAPARAAPARDRQQPLMRFPHLLPARPQRAKVTRSHAAYLLTLRCVGRQQRVLCTLPSRPTASRTAATSGCVRGSRPAPASMDAIRLVIARCHCGCQCAASHPAGLDSESHCAQLALLCSCAVRFCYRAHW